MAKFKSREERTYTNEKSGKEYSLLTPSERGAKFADEIKRGVRVSTNMKDIVGEDGKAVPLSEAGRAYRAGYLDAQRDSGRAYKHNEAIKAGLSVEETKEYKKLKRKEAKEYLKSHKKKK